MRIFWHQLSIFLERRSNSANTILLKKQFSFTALYSILFWDVKRNVGIVVSIQDSVVSKSSLKLLFKVGRRGFQLRRILPDLKKNGEVINLAGEKKVQRRAKRAPTEM